MASQHVFRILLKIVFVYNNKLLLFARHKLRENIVVYTHYVYQHHLEQQTNSIRRFLGLFRLNSLRMHHRQ